MPDQINNHTTTLVPISFGKWFYFEVGVTLFFSVSIGFLAYDGAFFKESMYKLAYPALLLITINRLYETYKGNKGKGFYITIDADGIQWKLPASNSKQVIVWKDIKWVKWQDMSVAITYHDTFFKDTLLLDRISAHDKQVLLALLQKYCNDYSINLAA